MLVKSWLVLDNDRFKCLTMVAELFKGKTVRGWLKIINDWFLMVIDKKIEVNDCSTMAHDGKNDG